MTRVKLHPNLPRKTLAFKHFEQLSVEINRYYWTFRCSLEHTLKSMENVKKVTDLVEETGKNIDISAKKFISGANETERFARHTVLVMSVTAFEAYLSDVLNWFLANNLNPEKRYTISFKPDELEKAPDIKDHIYRKAIQSYADSIVGKNYSSRFDSICNIFVQYKIPRPKLSEEMQLYAVAACEARNCIIHSAGIIDDRAKSNLINIISTIDVGDVLSIDEKLTWKFLAALRDTARVIDVAARCRRKKTLMS